MTRFEESPDTLDGGAWVLGPRRALVWVTIDQAITQDVMDTHRLIACPSCHARVSERCKTKTGKPRSPHAVRLVVKRCGCGGRLGHWRKLCDDCHVTNRRESTRLASQRLRARRRQAA